MCLYKGKKTGRTTREARKKVPKRLELNSAIRRGRKEVQMSCMEKGDFPHPAREGGLVTDSGRQGGKSRQAQSKYELGKRRHLKDRGFQSKRYTRAEKKNVYLFQEKDSNRAKGGGGTIRKGKKFLDQNWQNNRLLGGNGLAHNKEKTRLTRKGN